MQELITIYLAAYNDYLDQVETDEIIKFVVYLIWCICIVLPIWFKYLRTLNDKIFRTKGMLNMIPMEIVHKNEALREVFIKGEFLDSVKWEERDIYICFIDLFYCKTQLFSPYGSLF